MKFGKISLAFAAIATLITQACSEGSEVGESIVQDNVYVIVDSSFTLTGKTVENDVVLSRTITQLIGQVDAPGYGTLSSECVTQFMPALKLDTTNVKVENIDSLTVKMMLSYGAYIGDSIAPMGLEVYPLTKQLPSPIYSNFDPTGYYDTKPIGSAVYNLSFYGKSLTYKSLGYHQVIIHLPVEMGRKLYTDYKTNPQAFNSPAEFAKIFPGLYFRNSYGSGRVSRVSNTSLQLHYHKTYYDTELKKDTTTYHTGIYFAVTPEIISNNDIKLNIADDVRNAVAAGDNILLAPAGLDVEFQFPVIDIIKAYKKNITSLGVVNTLTFQIPAEVIRNKYNIRPPEYVLMVLSKDKKEFFEQNKINDDKTSFYAQYDAGIGTYAFPSMRQYLLDCLAKYDAGTLTPDDYTFTFTPVNITTETPSGYYGTSYVSAITPYVTGLAMTKINFKKAKIRFYYTKQTVNF